MITVSEQFESTSRHEALHAVVGVALGLRITRAWVRRRDDRAGPLGTVEFDGPGFRAAPAAHRAAMQLGPSVEEPGAHQGDAVEIVKAAFPGDEDAQLAALRDARRLVRDAMDHPGAWSAVVALATELRRRGDIPGAEAHRIIRSQFNPATGGAR